jgi:hypothetical protein
MEMTHGMTHRFIAGNPEGLETMKSIGQTYCGNGGWMEKADLAACIARIIPNPESVKKPLQGAKPMKPCDKTEAPMPSLMGGNKVVTKASQLQLAGTRFEGKDKSEVFAELDENKDGKVTLSEVKSATDSKKEDFSKYTETSSEMDKAQFAKFLKDTEGPTVSTETDQAGIGTDT